MELLNQAQQFLFAATPDVVQNRLKPASRKRSASFRSKYQLGKVLGKGTYSIVRKGMDIDTKERVAVKCIDQVDLAERDAKALRREVKILRSIKHPNIMGFKDFFYDSREKMFFIVTEFCPGGELFEAVVAKTYYPEKVVRKIVLRLADALHYLHKKDITHRDLKPENILLQKSHKNGDFDPEDIKLADFGFAFQRTQDQIEEGHQLKTVCGSPIYVAPEILKHHYSTQSKKSSHSILSSKSKGYPCKTVDVWSLGIITYVLLCGYPPFMEDSSKGDSNDKLFEKIRRGKFEFEEKYWKNISPQAKDLINKMLVVDPNKRYKISDVLNHPWFQATPTGKEKTKGKLM